MAGRLAAASPIACARRSSVHSALPAAFSFSFLFFFHDDGDDGYGHGDGAFGAMDDWDEAEEDADGGRMPTLMKRQLRSNADEISEPESIEECSDEEAFGGGAPLHFHAE